VPVTKDEFSRLAPSIPLQAGIYKYFGAGDQIIYVGKAKHLRKRVSSYFSKQASSFKTQRLVQEIMRIECTIVDSEQDALLLENSLIKQYQPRYNMMLKDDRSYPYIVIKNEEFPRIFLTRRLIKDGSEYLGPYTSIDHVRGILDWMRQTFPIRSCSLPLTEKSIAKGKFKECLEYHIGNCKAPCVAFQSRAEYAWMVNQFKEVLKGKMGDITRYYKKEMLDYAEQMEFEKAEIIKKKLEFIRQYQSKSVVVNPKIDQVDVCTVISGPEFAIVNYMVLAQGSIIHTHNATIEKKLDEEDRDILIYTLFQLRERYHSTSKEIVAEIPFDFEDGITITNPKSGDKKKLIELSVQNAQYAYQEMKRKKALQLHEQSDEERVLLLQQLQTDLRLSELPLHIECFDNSNFQGAYPVSAMVCFKHGLPFKQEYRHFHIKTVEGINDFASMKETVYRRYKRVLDEGKPLPQLIIIDGGKGQLSSAMETIRDLNLFGKVTVIGLAKNIEEIFYPGDQESLKLPFQGDSLNMLKRIRDEVHRFGITFHRKTRSKGIIKNELEEIEGIGEKTAQQLLKQYKSVKTIQAQSIEELSKIVGQSKAVLIQEYFKTKR
jgi:excinuclease ABC subunit C